VSTGYFASRPDGRFTLLYENPGKVESRRGIKSTQAPRVLQMITTGCTVSLQFYFTYLHSLVDKVYTKLNLINPTSGNICCSRDYAMRSNV